MFVLYHYQQAFAVPDTAFEVLMFTQYGSNST